jgi:hypothetical protein
MSFHVTCGSCGHRNPLGRLYCVKCGAKLEVSPETVRPEVSSAQAFGRWLARMVRLAVTLGLLAGLVQLLRPVPPMGQSGTVQHANEFREKADLLNYALLEKQVARQQFSEAEINGYLEQVVQNTPNRQGEGLLQFELQMINVKLKPDQIVTVFLSTWKSLSLTYEITARPLREEGAFALEIQRFRLGHLPLPGPAAEWVAGRVSRVFSQMEREKSLLDQLATLEVQEGVAIGTTPGR